MHHIHKIDKIHQVSHPTPLPEEENIVNNSEETNIQTETVNTHQQEIIEPTKMFLNDVFSLGDEKSYGRHFENVELVTVKQARKIAKKNKFTLTIGYNGKKLLGYLKGATNLPRNQRFFKIEKNDRLVSAEGDSLFFDGTKFIQYDEQGQEK